MRQQAADVRFRADLIAVLFALTLPTVVTWIYFVALVGHPSALQQTAYMVGKSVQFALPIVWVLGVQRRRLEWRPPELRHLLSGVAVGAAIVTATLLIYFGWLKPENYFTATGEEVRRRVVGFGLSQPWQFVAMAGFYALVHSLLEEYYWRWFVFGQLQRLAPLGTAIVVSSLGFTAHHVLVVAAYFGWFSLLTLLLCGSVTVGGIIWAWMYHRTGSIYASWVSHLLVDAGIFAIGYDLARFSQ